MTNEQLNDDCRLYRKGGRLTSLPQKTAEHIIGDAICWYEVLPTRSVNKIMSNRLTRNVQVNRSA